MPAFNAKRHEMFDQFDGLNASIADQPRMALTPSSAGRAHSRRRGDRYAGRISGAATSHVARRIFAAEDAGAGCVIALGDNPVGIAGRSVFNSMSMIRGEVSVTPLTTEAG